MATQEQIDQIAKILRQTPPAPFFQKVSESQVGIGAVMGYLSEVDTDATAGEIAAFMGVSSARVAVLLKKMVAQGLIVKERSATDARVTIVHLTESGAETARRMKDSMCEKIAEVIDKIGMERLLDFLKTAGEIARLAPGPCPCRRFN